MTPKKNRKCAQIRSIPQDTENTAKIFGKISNEFLLIPKNYLAKVEAVGSSPITRSIFNSKLRRKHQESVVFCLYFAPDHQIPDCSYFPHFSASFISFDTKLTPASEGVFRRKVFLNQKNSLPVRLMEASTARPIFYKEGP